MRNGELLRRSNNRLNLADAIPDVLGAENPQIIFPCRPSKVTQGNNKLRARRNQKELCPGEKHQGAINIFPAPASQNVLP